MRITRQEWDIFTFTIRPVNFTFLTYNTGGCPNTIAGPVACLNWAKVKMVTEAVRNSLDLKSCFFTVHFMSRSDFTITARLGRRILDDIGWLVGERRAVCHVSQPRHGRNVWLNNRPIWQSEHLNDACWASDPARLTNTSWALTCLPSPVCLASATVVVMVLSWCRPSSCPPLTVSGNLVSWRSHQKFFRTLSERPLEHLQGCFRLPQAFVEVSWQRWEI